MKVTGNLTLSASQIFLTGVLSASNNIILSGNIIIPRGGGTFFGGNGIAIGTQFPYESIHVVDSNIRIEGSGDLAYIVKNYDLPNAPQFRMGSIIHGGDGDPEIRFIYSDSVTNERSVFEFDKKGIVASVKPPGYYGSHFEGFISGDVEPLFRLNSYQSMSLELGEGSGSWTDVHLRRKKQGHLRIHSQLSGGTHVTGNLDVANIYSSDGHLHLSSTFGYVAVSGNLKVMGNLTADNFLPGGVTTTVNEFSGSVYLVAGPNITINSGSNIIAITGSAGGGGPVTGSDNFFVTNLLKVSGTITNPVGHLILSSTNGSITAFSSSLDFVNGDEPYHITARDNHLIFSSSLSQVTVSSSLYVRGNVSGTAGFFVGGFGGNGLVAVAGGIGLTASFPLVLSGAASASIYSADSHVILSSSRGSTITVSGAFKSTGNVTVTGTITTVLGGIIASTINTVGTIAIQGQSVAGGSSYAVVGTGGSGNPTGGNGVRGVGGVGSGVGGAGGDGIQGVGAAHGTSAGGFGGAGGRFTGGAAAAFTGTAGYGIIVNGGNATGINGFPSSAIWASGGLSGTAGVFIGGYGGHSLVVAAGTWASSGSIPIVISASLQSSASIWARHTDLILSSSANSLITVSGNLKVSGQVYSQNLFTVSTTSNVVTVDFNSGSSWIVNLSGSSADVTASLTNMQAGSAYTIKAIQGPDYRNLLFSGTGPGISGSRFPNSGSIPTMTSGNLSEDIYTIWFDGKRPYITYLQNWL